MSRQRIINSIKKRLGGKHSAVTRGLALLREDCQARFQGDGRTESNDKLLRFIDKALSYHRWKRWLGPSILRPLGILPPQFSTGAAGIVACLEGIDVDKEMRMDGNFVVIGDIRLPKPQGEADMQMFGMEWDDIVLSALLRRRLSGFDDKYERIYTLLASSCGSEGPYEINDVALQAGDVVIDCGANMGLFSAVAARNGCSVFAFEPIPIVVEKYLSQTAAIYPAVTVFQNALWNRKEDLLFKMMSQNMGATTAVTKLSKGKFAEFRVKTVVLDDFVEEQGLERVDFIKADIEGAERNMLQGARKVLKRFAPKLAICTYHLPDDPQVIRNLILEANPAYRIVTKYKKLYAHVPAF